MKTITLTDDQFDTLFEFVDDKVTTIVDASVDYNDSEILNEWEDLLDVPLHRSSYYKYYRSEFFCTLSLPLEKSSVDLCVL